MGKCLHKMRWKFGIFQFGTQHLISGGNTCFAFYFKGIDLRTYHRINEIMALLGNFSHKVIITLYCSRKELFMNVLNKKINYLKPTCMYGQGYLMNVDEARDIC